MEPKIEETTTTQGMRHIPKCLTTTRSSTHADNPKMTREINDVLTRQEWNKGADKVYDNIPYGCVYR